MAVDYYNDLTHSRSFKYYAPMRVAVINSYNLPGIAGRQTRRVAAFARALADRGLIENETYSLEVVDSNKASVIAEQLKRVLDDGVELIHAIGTPNAVLAAEMTNSVPIVYYGAHPENIGRNHCMRQNITGYELSLPFTSNYKQFRFLKQLLPGVKVVWTLFYANTIFVRPEMLGLHEAARAAGCCWLESLHGKVGFTTLAGLCYIIGLNYMEHVYQSLDELQVALQQVDPRGSVIMAYNDSLYCEGAMEMLLGTTQAACVPVIWNNNAQITTYGALAGIGANFETVSYQSGLIAAEILNGVSPTAIPRRLHTEQVAWINLDVARRYGLSPNSTTLAYFDEAISFGTKLVCV